MTSALLVAHTALCAVLFWASFCRTVMTTHRTLAPVRAAICLQATAALVAGAAPWLWSYRPELPALVLLASMVIVQTVTALLWRGGVPCDFQRTPKVPMP